MDQQQIISALEDRAKRVGLPMAEVCKRAGIHPTTFSRWKLSERNPQPKGAAIPSVAKIEAVIAERETAESRSEAA
ncbi:MAG: hypothetical protein J7521_20240 [Caulobacter sp.]|nr:hypothetical protein [Caulobacter sp.]